MSSIFNSCLEDYLRTYPDKLILIIIIYKRFLGLRKINIITSETLALSGSVPDPQGSAAIGIACSLEQVKRCNLPRRARLLPYTAFRSQ